MILQQFSIEINLQLWDVIDRNPYLLYLSD